MNTRKHNARHGDEVALYRASEANYPTTPNYFGISIPFYLADIGRERVIGNTWHVLLWGANGAFRNSRERAFHHKEDAIAYALLLAEETGFPPTEWIF